MAADKGHLEALFSAQREFMELLQRKRSFPHFPVDLSTKSGQKFVKDIAADACGELFEAIALLRNSKPHRATDIPQLDRAAFVEELSDALHMFLEVCILSDVSASELAQAFHDKQVVNVKRIENGY